MRGLRESWKNLKYELKWGAYFIAPFLLLVLPVFGAVFWLLWIRENYLKEINPRSLWCGSKEVYCMTVRGEGIWAVIFRGAVELRSGKRAPNPVKTEFEKDSELRVPRYKMNAKTGRVTTKWETIPNKIHVINTIHTGGKVLGTLTTDKFYRVTKITGHPGDVIKLTKIQATKVLGAI